MPTRNVDLTEHFDSFVESGISSGRFSDASEVVREGLRLLEQSESENRAKLEYLRSLTHNAFASLDRGEGLDLVSTEDVDALVNEALIEMRAARSVAHG
jgi:antitoxin ParD1/3/4